MFYEIVCKIIFYELLIVGIDVSADNFMDVLDNGVYICDLANVIHKKAEECVKEGKCAEVAVHNLFKIKLLKMLYILLYPRSINK